MTKDKLSEKTYKVTPVKHPPDAVLSVPGSKSITNRALLLAAFASGKSTLKGALNSDDTVVFIDSLNRLGIKADWQKDKDIIVEGNGRIPAVDEANLYVGNAGTACRFLIPACATSAGRFHFDGTERMRERPLSELVDALEKLGAKFEPAGRKNLPLILAASGLDGGDIAIDTSRSGQFLSGLMMASIRARSNMKIQPVGDLVGKPYIDITFEMMQAFEIPIIRRGYAEFTYNTSIFGPNYYFEGKTYNIEPDASTASYFFAAAALNGGKITVRDLWQESSIQGDIKFLNVLSLMGCKVTSTQEGTVVEGPERLKGIEIYMKDISDTFMTLAAIAPFADSPTTITGLAHTRGQESDRVNAMASELARLGAKVSSEEGIIKIQPSKLKGCAVQTYNDHRIAMALSLIGLKVPDVVITGAECVNKTAPEYFDLLNLIERAGN
jgi:3-phosphoshikimate 1-carboxyvinyltransferase